MASLADKVAAKYGCDQPTAEKIVRAARLMRENDKKLGLWTMIMNDGDTKSIGARRLPYLSGEITYVKEGEKFEQEVYDLLNEYEEAERAANE